MATPLKLWQHFEPKRLWTILGGLSALVHIGILGLSLPYVLELMQASESDSTETIPIELVVVSAEEEPSELIDEPSPNPSAPPVQEQYSPPPAPVQTASENNSTFSQDPVNAAVAAPVQTLPEEKETISQDLEPEKKIEDGLPNDSQSSLPESNGEEANDSNETLPPDEDIEGSDIGGVDETPAVPTLPGSPTLPMPGELANNQPIPRPAALSIVSFREVGEVQRDTGKTPPRPKDDAIAAAIVLDSVAQGCGKLEFSQVQWTYRVAVDVDGSVMRASIWSNGIARAVSEEEGAIACLIESAGFEFEPALFEGEPIPDDNLLLTINVIEVPQ